MSHRLAAMRSRQTTKPFRSIRTTFLPQVLWSLLLLGALVSSTFPRVQALLFSELERLNTTGLIASCLQQDPSVLQFRPRWNVTNDAETNRRYFIGQERWIRHGGLTRWFMEHRPDTVDEAIRANATVPLLIILHHGRGNMRSSVGFNRFTEKDPYLRLAWTNRFLVLSPNGCHKRTFFRGLNTKGFRQDWADLLGGGLSGTGADDVGFIMSMIDWAVANRNVNPRRVYVTGISNGGTMTQRLVLERPGVFAAAATVGATLPVNTVPFPSRGTPILIMHGTKDTRVPWSGGNVTQSRGQCRSAEATRDYFVMVNNATAPPAEAMLPDVDPADECRIVSQYYSHPQTPVLFYRLDGGGHFAAGPDVPEYIANCGFEATMGNFCHDAEGAQLIWDFMTQFELPR